jgi:acetyltransferase-like isoleucine patch superfamily enzyme
VNAVEKCIRLWRLARTRALWGWRFHSLGRRSVVGKCRFVLNPGVVSIGHHTTLYDFWTLADLNPASAAGGPKIRIGSYCSIMWDFQCNAGVSVEVQDYVLMAPRVFITDSDHVVDPAGERTTLCREEVHSAPVIIEHDCWLGVNAVILKGVRIGHHSIVGANAVVTRDVEPCTVVAGIPAKPIGRTGAGALRPAEHASAR